MSRREFQRKAEALKKLGDAGKLVTIEKVKRDSSVIKCYKSDLLKRIWRQYEARNRDFANIGTQQIWPQIRSLPVGTPMKIRIL